MTATPGIEVSYSVFKPTVPVAQHFIKLASPVCGYSEEVTDRGGAQAPASQNRHPLARSSRMEVARAL